MKGKPVTPFLFNLDDERPFRDKRFAKCVIRTVGTEAQRQAAREKRIEIYAAIQERMAEEKYRSARPEEAQP